MSVTTIEAVRRYVASPGKLPLPSRTVPCRNVVRSTVCTHAVKTKLWWDDIYEGPNERYCSCDTILQHFLIRIFTLNMTEMRFNSALTKISIPIRKFWTSYVLIGININYNTTVLLYMKQITNSYFVSIYHKTINIKYVIQNTIKYINKIQNLIMLYWPQIGWNYLIKANNIEHKQIRN